MFDLSFFELLVIGAVALVVIGPERLPRVARTVGQWVGKVQRYVSDVKNDINREMELEELRRLRAEMNETARSVEATARSMENSLRQQAAAIDDPLAPPGVETGAGQQALQNRVTEAQPLSGSALDARGEPAAVSGVTPPASGVGSAAESTAAVGVVRPTGSDSSAVSPVTSGMPESAPASSKATTASAVVEPPKASSTHS